MRFLALLCAVLMLVPTRAHAVDFQTGAGYVQGECREIGDDDRRACFTGERFDLALNGIVKDKDDPETRDSDAKKSVRSGGGANWLGGVHGDGAWIVLAVLIVVLLVMGIVAFLGAVFSRRLSVGVYSSFTFQSARLEGEGGVDVEKYRSQRTGFHVNTYLIRDFDFVLNFGVAAATSQILTTSADEGDETYSLRGTSSKLGIGYLPFNRTGVYGTVELENTHFDSFSLSKYARSSPNTKIPNGHASASFVLGLAF